MYFLSEWMRKEKGNITKIYNTSEDFFFFSLLETLLFTCKEGQKPCLLCGLGGSGIPLFGGFAVS